MIELGSNINQKDKVNETALFYAAREGKTDVCKLLLEHGSEVNIVDHKKQTALYFAKKGGHTNTVQLLIEHGAINTKDGRLRQSDINKLQKQKNKQINTTSLQQSKADDKSLSDIKHKKPSQVSSILDKKKSSLPKDDIKLTYKLVFSDITLKQLDVNNSEFKSFSQQYPQIAQLLKNPDKLTNNHNLMETIQLDNWQNTALMILNALWKLKGANIFHQPVNPIKLGKQTNTRHSRLSTSHQRTHGLRNHQKKTQSQYLQQC